MSEISLRRVATEFLSERPEAREEKTSITQEIIKIYLENIPKDLKHFSGIVNKDNELSNKLFKKLENIENTVEEHSLSFELAHAITEASQENEEKFNFHEDDVLEQIPKNSQDSAREFWAAFLRLGTTSGQAFAELISKDTRVHWQEVLNASKGKDRWLKLFKYIGEKYFYEITDEDIINLNKAIDTAVKKTNFTFPKYWERGQIWSSC